jgi:hypothetical protein
LSNCTQFSRRVTFRQRFRRLPPTGRRLGEGGASNNVQAGDKCSNLHNFFRGTTAPLAPNRLLAAGILPRVLSCRFHVIVGLHTIFESYYFSTKLSDCTHFSRCVIFPQHCRIVHTFRGALLFQFIVGLHTLSKSCYFSTKLSNCTQFSRRVSFPIHCRIALCVQVELLIRYICVVSED